MILLLNLMILWVRNLGRSLLAILLLRVALAGLFGGSPLAATWSRWSTKNDLIVWSLGWTWDELEGWAQLCPFPSLNGLRDSLGGVSCRVAGLLTVAAQGSESESTRDEKGQLFRFGHGNCHCITSPTATGQSCHRACPGSREGTSTSPCNGGVSKNFGPFKSTTDAGCNSSI